MWKIICPILFLPSSSQYISLSPLNFIFLDIIPSYSTHPVPSVCMDIIPPNTEKSLKSYKYLSMKECKQFSFRKSSMISLLVYLYMLLFILVFESQIIYSVLVFSSLILESPLYHWMIIFSLEVLYSVLLGRWFLVLIPVPLTSGISYSKTFDPLM